MWKEVPFVSVSGSDRECGEQVGRATRGAIRSNLARYLEIIHRKTGMSRGDLDDFVTATTPSIKSFDEGIFAEIEGIAAGAGVSVADLVILNARTELMGSISPRRSEESECTALGATPEATASGHTLIGENWDWKSAVTDNTVVIAVDKPGVPKCLIFTEAGMVGKIGLNALGIGVCINFLASSEDKGAVGVPFHVMLRKVLSARNMHEASRVVTQTRRGASGNYLIGSAGGEVIDIEVTPRQLDMLLPVDGIITHANHFSSPILRPFDTHRFSSTMTIVREDRARRLLKTDHGRVDVDSFKRVFRDHFSHPHSICRHADTTLHPLDQSITGASIIMDLDERVMHVTAGPPCEHHYATIPLANH